MNRIPQAQLDNLERQILDLGEYDKLEITYKNEKIDITLKSTRRVSFRVDN